MKMTYAESIIRYNALSELEKGRDAEHPYDLPWDMWVLITTMMNALKPYVESYQKGRNARFTRAAKEGGIRRDQFDQSAISSPEVEMKFRTSEEKVLASEINILMPTSKLELKIKENKYAPSLLVRLQGLFIESDKKFEMEEGDASPVMSEPEEDLRDGNVIKMDRNV